MNRAAHPGWLCLALVASAAHAEPASSPPYAARAAWSAHFAHQHPGVPTWTAVEVEAGSKEPFSESADSAKMDGGGAANLGPGWLPPLAQKELTERLRAVVQVTRGGQRWCTATVVADAATDRRALLLAGHCAFESDGTRVETVDVGGAPIALGDGWVQPEFADCMAKGTSFDLCTVHEDARDLMTLPVPARLAHIEPWFACAAQPPNGIRLAYGFMTGDSGLGAQLMVGHFGPDEYRDDDRWALSGDAKVAGGDSGGPVLDMGGFQALFRKAPSVCWVISGYLAESGRLSRSLLGASVATRFERASKLPAQAFYAAPTSVPPPVVDPGWGPPGDVWSKPGSGWGKPGDTWGTPSGWKAPGDGSPGPVRLDR